MASLIHLIQEAALFMGTLPVIPVDMALVEEERPLLGTLHACGWEVSAESTAAELTISYPIALLSWAFFTL